MRRSVWMFASLLALGCHARGEAARSDRRPESAQASQAAVIRETAASGSGPAAVPVPEAPKRIYHVAALGDSITDERVGGGKYLAYLRKACPRSTFHHFGRGGDMTNQMLARLERDLLPEVSRLKLDTLVVLGGVNDLYSNLTAGRTNERIEESLLSIYERARAQGLRTIGITVLPWGGFARYFTPDRGENTRALNAWILGQVAQEKLDQAVDGYARLSCGHPEKLCPEFEMVRPDGLHPGPEGHRVLGELLLNQAFSDCL